jgi:hypothetical protein
MLVIYGVCIIGLIGTVFLGLNRRSRNISANATATAAVVSTQRANATSTAMVHATELAQYQIHEPFNNNRYEWLIGRENGDFWKGYRRIKDGVYVWQVDEVKKTFVSWANYPLSKENRDFDIYVDTKQPSTPIGKVCSGILFRILNRTDDSNDYYYFSLCNNSMARVSFHGEKEGWERLEVAQVSTYPGDWNRLEIHARGSHFTFVINSVPVFEVDDDRLSGGGLALAVEVKEQVPALVLFDNFGYQRR